MTLECQRCGKPTHVPVIIPPAAAATASTDEILAELERHLKENASQRTEVIGYINQLSIQVHRWQHRLKTLNERETELEIQIAAVTRERS